ncbi:hypothetical protein CEXT_344181 [Caerostris extrusa]|uniref:Uncharacterized protein n=1 Tax=Caerostris extrusa TaxID=172846 RepID=A0AAV4XX93_CAEEX|nr:hypothetical protein CEXT_344181 [Caerostris extrusa]
MGCISILKLTWIHTEGRNGCRRDTFCRFEALELRLWPAPIPSSGLKCKCAISFHSATLHSYLETAFETLLYCSFALRPLAARVFRLIR